MTKNPEDLGYETSTEAMAPDFQNLSLFDTGWKLTPPTPLRPTAPLTLSLLQLLGSHGRSRACPSDNLFVFWFLSFPQFFSFRNRDRFLARDSYNLNPSH